MRPRLLASAILLAALVPCAANAQSNTTNSTSANPGSSGTSTAQPNQTPQALPGEIKQKLQQQGFTDVQVIPGSFLVSAKDKQGDPVNMVIGPHSMMIMTSSQVSGTSNSTGQSPSTPSTK